MKTLDELRNETDRARRVIREDLEEAGPLGLNDLLNRHNGEAGQFSASVVRRAVLSMVDQGEAEFTDNFLVQLSPDPTTACRIAR